MINNMPSKIVLPPKGPHVSVTVTTGIQEGKSKADVEALVAKEVAIAKEKVPGCVYFGLHLDDAAIKANNGLLCEKYATAADHMAINGALDAAGLVKSADGVFATYAFKEFKFTAPQAEFDHPGYADLLAQFETIAPVIKIATDIPGKHA